jgi:hypothetical protein
MDAAIQQKRQEVQVASNDLLKSVMKRDKAGIDAAYAARKQATKDLKDAIKAKKGSK